MNYKIKIEFVKNRENAGKLSLVSSTGEVLLSKVPVTIPDGIGLVLEKSGLVTTALTINKDYAKNNIFGDLYIDAFNKVIKNDITEIITDTKGTPLFCYHRNSNNVAGLTGDVRLFILNENDYMVLSKLARDHSNTIDMSAEQVSFLWFPENVKQHSNKLESLNDLIKIENKIDVYKKNLLKEMQEKKKETNRVKTPEIKKIIPENKTPLKPNKVESVLKNKGYTFNGAMINSNGPQNKTNRDDVGALDILFMYQYPELAILYRPNSLLAWAAYFGRDVQGMSNEYLKNNINNINGFENIESSDLKYNKDGYSVSLYNDRDKETIVGTLTYNQTNNEYKVVSPDGAITCLQEVSNGEWKGNTSDNEGGLILYEFVQADTGYVGNLYAVSKDGCKVNSGLQLDSDFSNISSPTELVNINQYSANLAEQNSNIWSQESSLNMSLDPSYNSVLDISPPPPPPPPEDGMSWATSSDSYSRFSP